MKIMMLSQTIPFPIYSNGLTLRVYHLLKQFSRHAECYLLAFADRSLKAEEKEYDGEFEVEKPFYLFLKRVL